MSIDQGALKEFSQLEIISHCLYEMTFMGFDEEEIQEQIAEFEKTIEDLKNMTEEEKRANTKSLDDLLKELDEE
jgi:N12 class adenine-specific DNA methylase